MRVRLSWFISNRLESLPASSRFLLLALETYCHAKDTRGSVSTEVMTGLVGMCNATVGDVAKLTMANIIAFDGTEYFLFGFEETYDQKLEREVDAILSDCDQSVDRYHWRGALETIEVKSNPRYKARWRMKVLDAWMMGDNAPRLTGGTRSEVVVRTKAKIDACADAMLQMIEDGETLQLKPALIE